MNVKQFMKHFWWANTTIKKVYVKTDISADPGEEIHICEYAHGEWFCWHDDLKNKKVNLFQISGETLTIHAR